VLQQTIPKPSRPVERVGRTLRGHWRFDALIDVGGMAAVYAATHSSGARGAIKILHPNPQLTPEVGCAFLRGGHRNVVRVLEDDLDEDGNVCIVMELLEGATLHDCAKLQGGRLAADEVLHVLDQVLDGLAALHDAGIVHRDIKPENLFLTTNGQVKVLDFGLARDSTSTSASESVTFAGVVMGTPEFMPPEQARGRWDLVDNRSDLWSLGATAFALLSGQLVHDEASIPELLLAVIEKSARSLTTALPAAHPALVALVARALERDPSLRWADARAMQAEARRTLVRCGYARPFERQHSGVLLPKMGRTAALHRARAVSSGTRQAQTRSTRGPATLARSWLNDEGSSGDP